MAAIVKVLGRAYPAFGAVATLYEVPSTIQAVGSSLMVCNQSSLDTTFTVAVVPLGVDVEEKHYIYFNTPVLANDTYTATIGITLTSADQVRVSSGSGEVSFSLFGQESGFMEGELMEWLTGEKVTGVDAGIQGQKSVTNDYLYLCVIGGEVGVAVWKKLLMSKSE